jgi:L-threonylcarbamoyladenylate synthase
MTEIDRAVAILRRGGLVAFPTETVYGLGADARSSEAVRRIFAAKGRPPTNPLIVHVSGVAMAKLYCNRWPQAARMLAQRLWPGPLTLVLPKAAEIVDEVTAGLETVALRMPNHPMALELLRRFDGPIAAPSANRSTRVSPTTAEHVRQELGHDVDIVLDGGPCAVGIESTVLDLSGATPLILRPGGVSRERIQSLIGAVDHVAQPATGDSSAPARSPGLQEVHYAPQTASYRVEGALAQSFPEHIGLVLIGRSGEMSRERAHLVEMPDTPQDYARHLYAALRELDQLKLEAIVVQMPPDEPRWLAVRDRLLRATRPLPPSTSL